jgi:hypothetical protein
MKQHRAQSELVCDKCHEGRLITIETTRNVNGSVRRRRQCTNSDCGHRETTIEISLEEFKSLERSREGFSKFQKLAGEYFTATDMGFIDKKDRTRSDLKCYTCAHCSLKKHKRVCSFDIPEAFSADSADCNLYQYQYKDGIKKLEVGLLMK